MQLSLEPADEHAKRWPAGTGFDEIAREVGLGTARGAEKLVRAAPLTSR